MPAEDADNLILNTPPSPNPDLVIALSGSGSDSENTPIVGESSHRVAMLRSIGMPPVKGDFRPIRQLGAGSFGEVWLVQEWVDDRPFRLLAVKFLHADKFDTTSDLFEEVEKLNPLTQKRGIVHVHHIEAAGDRPYFTMDYVDGGSLAAMIAVEPLPIAKAIAILRSLAEALDAVHAKGIIHCDLKPENILLNRDGEPMVADFGQARLKGKGPPRPGSWFYMAPEQMDADASQSETSCDIYALGAVFYKMVTGYEPRANAEAHESLKNASSVREQLKIHRESILAAPKPVGHYEVAGMDRPLRCIIDRCLDTDATRRFRDGHEVLGALDQRDLSLSSKRPMIKRGLASTIVVMLALFLSLTFLVPLIFEDHKAVYSDLMKDAFGRFSFLSRLASGSIDDNVKELKGHAIKWAQDPEVQKYCLSADKFALQERLQNLLINLRNDPDHSNDISVRSVSSVDRIGHTLAVVQISSTGEITAGVDKTVADLLWNWRDWFNGEGRDMDPREEPYPPISMPNISAPYLAFKKLPNESSSQSRRLAFSAPIKDSTNTPIGVLIIGVELMELYHTSLPDKDVGLKKQSTIERLYSDFPITIFDDKGHLLIHFQNNKDDDFNKQFILRDSSQPSLTFPYWKEGKIEMQPPPNNNLRKSIPKKYQEYVDLIKKGKIDQFARKTNSLVKTSISHADDNGHPLRLGENQMFIPDFKDPINNKKYASVFTYMPNAGWGILLQQDRNRAYDLIDELQVSLLWIGWSSYVFVLIVVSLLWWLILRRWWREENFING